MAYLCADIGQGINVLQNHTQSSSVPETAPAGFGARWLAETVQLRTGGHREHEAERYAIRTSGDAEQRLLTWAAFIGRRDGLREQITAWRKQATVSLLLIVSIALLAGLTSALAVLGDGSRPVNVIWALGSLLGVNLLMLLVWLLGFLASGPAPSLGRFWLWLNQRFQNQDAVHITRAWVSLSNQAGLTRWWLGLVSHTVWLAALIGVTCGLLLTLSLRSYAFSWETTILPESVFLSVVESLGWLPGKLGFQTPDAETIRQAGQSSGLASTIVQADAERRAWASWLVGCLVSYGVFPRLLLVFISGVRLISGTRRIRLDINAPRWLTLRSRLMPVSEAGDVLDPAPEVLPGSRIRQRAMSPGGEYTLVAFELDQHKDPLQLLPDTVRHSDWQQSFTVDSREERQAVLSFLENAPAGALLVICDASLSPDRGTWHWLAAALGYAAQGAVLLHNADTAEASRLEAWQRGLQDIGLAAANILTSPADVAAWRRV